MKTKVSLKELLYFSALDLYMTVCLLSVSFFYKYIEGLKSNIVLVFCVLLLCIKETIAAKAKKKELVFGMIIYLICGIVVLMGATLGFNSIIYLLLFVYSAHNIKIDKITKNIFWLSLIVFLFIVISSKVGLIEDYTSYALKGYVHYLGFRYGLYVSSLLSNITFLRYYIKQETISWKEIIFWSIGNYYCYILTISRLNFIIFCLLTGLLIIIKMKPTLIIKMKPVAKYLSYSYLVFLIFSVYLITNYNYNSTWMQIANIFSEGRVALQHEILRQYPISLLGRDIQWVGNAVDSSGVRAVGNYFYADNLYVNMILKYGIIVAGILLVLLTVAMYKAYKKNQIFLVMILSVIAAHGLIDDLVQNLYYNAFLLIVCSNAFDITHLYNRITKVKPKNISD